MNVSWPFIPKLQLISKKIYGAVKQRFASKRTRGKTIKIGYFILFLMPLVYPCSIFGQTRMQDSIASENVISNTVAIYNNSVGSQSGIYNGSDYQYERINEGIAFLDTAFLVKGSIVFNGVLYTDVPMLYDLVIDGVITQNYNKLHLTLLASDRISWFTLSGKTFIRISADSSKGTLLKTGFFQSLYSGKIQAWAKNRKIIEEFIADESAVGRMAVDKKEWYICKEGYYFKVSGKRAVLVVLHDKKNEIQQYMRKHKILFKNNMDNALVQIAAYYDEITK